MMVVMVVVFVCGVRSGFIVDFQFGILPRSDLWGALEMDFGGVFRKLGAARVESIE